MKLELVETTRGWFGHDVQGGVMRELTDWKIVDGGRVLLFVVARINDIFAIDDAFVGDDRATSIADFVGMEAHQTNRNDYHKTLKYGKQAYTLKATYTIVEVEE